MSASLERNLSTLGARIKAALEMEGRSQNSVETEMIKGGWFSSRGQLSSLISGRRGSKTTSLETIAALAKLLHVNFEWLAVGEGPMRRDGRIEQTPFEQAMHFARQANCREDAIQTAWARHKDRAGELAVFDWVNLIQAESMYLDRGGVPRPEDVVDEQLSTRRPEGQSRRTRLASPKGKNA